MVVINGRVKIEARTIELRRAKVKVRTYENAKVFLEGTSGRGRKHWAEEDFTKCKDSPEELTYFSATQSRPAIAIHGDHIHVLERDKNGSLVNLSFEAALQGFRRFMDEMKEKGFNILVEGYEF